MYKRRAFAGPYGDWLKYPCDEPCLLVSEVDGLRLLGASRHELLRRVPEAVAAVHQPGSTAAAAQLWEARCLFDDHSPRADRVLRDIRDDLPDAVQVFIHPSVSLTLLLPWCKYAVTLKKWQWLFFQLRDAPRAAGFLGRAAGCRAGGRWHM